VINHETKIFDIENRFSLFERLREKIKEDEVKIIISE